MHNIVSPALSNIKHIEHQFLTRNLQNSTHIYIDKSENNQNQTKNQQIIANKQIVSSLFKQTQDNLCILNQIHSNKVEIAHKNWVQGSEPKADAIVTNQPNLVLGIMTADCCPLLFADCNQPIIGAAHAGWRGARNGIINNTIESMLKLGSKLKDIHVVLGPCIHQESYEVGPEFYEDFLDEAPTNSQFFIKSSKANHFKFNLPNYITNKLLFLGLSAINNINYNTFSDPENFFSYRRYSLSGNQNDMGSLLSLISLKSDK